MIQITPIYAGLLALLLLALSYNVVLGRRLHKVSVGDGAEKDLIKRMRTQSNWVEYAPIGIVLLALAELQGVSPIWLHVAGLALLVGRFSHAYGFSRKPQIVPLRKLGMYLTFGSILGLSLINIMFGLFQNA
jgi:uncharacterized membrane protein YecN with MAPEG domain